MLCFTANRLFILNGFLSGSSWPFSHFHFFADKHATFSRFMASTQRLTACLGKKGKVMKKTKESGQKKQSKIHQKCIICICHSKGFCFIKLHPIHDIKVIDKVQEIILSVCRALEYSPAQAGQSLTERLVRGLAPV